MIGALKINPLNSQELFLGIGASTISNEILYYSTDGGESWNAYSNGLPREGSVDCIAINPVNKKMCIGVWSVIDSSGIYQIDLVSSVKDRLLPTKTTLLQNYPNPFNPTTKIQFSVAHPSVVTLKIYNVLGQEVATLVNGYEEVGVKSIDFDASRFSSGIYFYKMVAGTYSAVKKMIFMK